MVLSETFKVLLELKGGYPKSFLGFCWVYVSIYIQRCNNNDFVKIYNENVGFYNNIV